MATIQQVQRGFKAFVDREVAGAFDGWQKAAVSGLADLLADNLPNVVAGYATHPLVFAMGILDTGTGEINIDAAYNAFVPKLNGSKIPIPIPKGRTIKLGKEEIDLLMRYIKEG